MLKVLDLTDPETKERMNRFFSEPVVRVEFGCGSGGYVNKDAVDGFIARHREECGCGSTPETPPDVLELVTRWRKALLAGWR